MRPTSSGFLRPRAIVGSYQADAVDREVTVAREDRPRLQPVKVSDRVAEMGRVGIADFLGQMRQIEVLIGKVQQVPRTFPGAEGTKRDTGLHLEQVQEARGG